MRTLVVDGSYFLSIGIPRGGRGWIFQIRTLWHGSSNMDSDSSKESLLLHHPRQAPPPKQTLGENPSGNWCACSFFKQNRAQYILSLFWDGFYSPEVASSCWTQSILIDSCDWTRCVILCFNSLIFFFPQSERAITLIHRYLHKSRGRCIIISSTSLTIGFGPGGWCRYCICGASPAYPGSAVWETWAILCIGCWPGDWKNWVEFCAELCSCLVLLTRRNIFALYTWLLRWHEIPWRLPNELEYFLNTGDCICCICSICWSGTV